jgi:phasin family protein
MIKMNMQKETLELVNRFNENALKSAKRLGELNMHTFEHLLSKQTEVVNACYEAGAHNAELLTQGKDYREVVAAQTDMLRSCGDKLVGNIRETANVMNNVSNELNSMLEDAIQFTSENLQKASEISPKAA